MEIDAYIVLGSFISAHLLSIKLWKVFMSLLKMSISWDAEMKMVLALFLNNFCTVLV